MAKNGNAKLEGKRELAAAKAEQKAAKQQLVNAKKGALSVKKAEKKAAVDEKKAEKREKSAEKDHKKALKIQNRTEKIKRRSNGEKKPKKLIMIIIIAVLVLLLIGGGAFFATKLFVKKDSKPKPTEAPITTTTSSDTVELDNLSASGAGNTGGSSEGMNTSSSANALDGASSLAEGNASSTPETPSLEIDKATLNLPQFQYKSESALEIAVHRDIKQMLSSKDDRPGVQFEAVVIAGQYRLENGDLRVITYVWGLRYAIAENTLINYGSLAGPVALDYKIGTSGAYELQELTLAKRDDAYKDSVKQMCGAQDEVAKSITRKSYDVELHMRMARSVSDYINENNINVQFFTAGGDTYNKDGTFYVDPALATESSSQGVDTVSKDPAEEYDYYKSIPQ